MLDSKISQFTLSNDGQIFWQEKLNNPLAGVAVAVLEKGDHALKPVIKVLENENTAKYDAQELKNCLNVWLNTYFSTVLEPLMLLEVPSGAAINDDPVSKISAKIYDGMGIVHRSDIEDLISLLTPETRADLRAKKIRLGPVLAFIPALNKPAAVRLKSTLWALFNDMKLPAFVPADGVVSVKISDENPNEQYYRAIGYPLYGGRAVRIDMLDRVINSVYDSAQKGKFQAKHEMAEWLGCSISDLYEVLKSMGHVKIYDPAEEKAKDLEGLETAVAENKTSEALVTAKVETEENTEVKAEDSPKDKAEDKAKDKAKNKEAEKAEADKAAEKKENIKPELATFRLKKGKASQKSSMGNIGAKKTYNSDKKKDFKKKKDFSKKPHKKKERDNSPRVMSVEAKKNAEDNPFAILQQLKK